MGADKKQALQVSFDSRLKLEFHGAKVTSDAGLLAYRELDEALELTAMGHGLLDDWRTGKNTQHSMVALVRQSIFSRLAGYEDTNDAERLSVNNGQATKYGFGWYVDALDGHRNVGHGGSTSGFSASIQRFLEDKLTVIILTNTDEQVATSMAKKIATFFFVPKRAKG